MNGSNEDWMEKKMILPKNHRLSRMRGCTKSGRSDERRFFMLLNAKIKLTRT